ncbi:unnamed protein product [Cunninghamella blakesleeana]
MLKRKIIYVIILISSSIFTVLHLKKLQDQIKEQHQEVHTDTTIQDQERFISYFPHGDFFEQLEALKVGLRIAQSTNRTLIAPQLILGKSFGWLPFERLAKRYEIQDKTLLSMICKKVKEDALSLSPPTTTNPQRDHSIEIELCEDKDDWTEIPWTVLFNTSFLEENHKLKMIDRKNHRWRQEITSSSEITILDPLTYLENGTIATTSKSSSKKVSITFSSFKYNRDWKKWFKDQLYPPSPNDLKKPLPHNKVFESKLKLIATKYIQLGSLSKGSAYPTFGTEKQAALMQDVSDLLVPNYLDSLEKMANKITQVLGGKKEYISYHLHMSMVARTELQIQKANALLFQNHQWLNNVKLLEEMEKKEEMELEDGNITISNTTVNNNNINNNIDDPTLILDKSSLLDLINSIVFEILGDMPINQAVSASFPIQPSTLLDELNNKSNDINNNKNSIELLNACVDYRLNIDPLYPIVYLVTDIPWDSNILKPLNDFFPCLFTKNDFKKWNIIQTGWASNDKVGLYDVVDYDEILSPLLDMLIAVNAYSFLETPITPITRFVSRQHNKLF